ncbi:TIR domain-containing protein [Avibacterium avium]|uniref:TIR domain-containing protein n=1 Tax=Avibacterium avium TaxID=751 RepID=UPI003BF84F04
MTRKVFYSFHFDNDAWRAGQVRNMGVVDGTEPVKGNRWEDVKSKSDEEIKKWINDNLKDKSCLVVLIGEKTSERYWVQYEIETAWNLGKAVCGVYIHKLKNKDEEQSKKGKNPFDAFTLNEDKKKLSEIAPVFESSYSSSQYVYNDIKENLEDLVEEAIKIRKKY